MREGVDDVPMVLEKDGLKRRRASSAPHGQNLAQVDAPAAELSSVQVIYEVCEDAFGVVMHSRLVEATASSSRSCGVTDMWSLNPGFCRTGAGQTRPSATAAQRLWTSSCLRATPGLRGEQASTAGLR